MNSRKYIGFFVIGAIALFVTIYAITNETFNYQRYSNMESFEKEWAKVDSLEKKGLPKSAMEVVEKIYSKAKEIDNPAQIVKSLIHLMKYKTQLEEEGLVQSMYFLQEEIKTATFPTLPILQSFLADVYWGFYENNRWKFLDRTQTMNFDQDDILTWDLNKLFEKVMGLHQSALSETEKLKQIPLEIFDDIVVKNSSSRKFRPTVYDFVAHRALAFYMNEETGLTQPAYAFKLTEENVFSPASDFVKIKFETKDTLSLDLHAIQLMQDLIDFHIGDSDPSALVDIDLIRLSYVKNKSVHSLKETLYLDALKDLEKKYLFNEIGTEVSYQLASQYVSQANSYNPLVDDTYKWDRKTALEICDKAIERFPRAFGTQNCKSLRNQILSKELSLITEKVNLPNAPFRALVTYRNVDNVHFRILNYDKDVEQLFKTLYNDDLFKELVKIKPIKTWSVKIPNDGDMNSHSFEVKVPELGLGKYLILASPDEKFTLSKNAIAYTTTYISNISYIRRDNSDGTLDYYVLNRATGQPLPNVKVQIYYEVYDSKNYKYIYEKGPLVQTDELGYLKIPKTSGSRTVKCTFEYGDDFLDLEDKIYQYSPYDYEDRTYTSVVFFTDRGIYRPGQTIYFKGIMLETGKKQNKLLTNRSVTVELLDVNSQKVSSLALKTNDYGTFSGTFTAPTGVLTGAMTIRCQHGSKSVQVEEYKRPKFEVKFDPVTESFKLGDEVKITGFAQAYAGSNIDGAEVRYRVVRSATFPYWRWWWWSYRPISPDMEITSGVTSTDDKGKFEIKFEAIPDLSLDKKYKPQFTYTVYADVVDITGETRSNTTYVNVGYIALSVSLNMPAIVFKDKEFEQEIITRNLNGEFEPASGTITIHKLDEPNKIFRNRYWEQPDQYVMTKEEYDKFFPNDIYSDENIEAKWNKSQKVLDVQFNTKEEKKLKISELKNWTQGQYVLELKTKDKYGADVEVVKYFVLSDETSKQVPLNKTCWIEDIKIKAEPSESAKFSIGTAEENIRVLYEVEHDKKIVTKEWVELNKEKRIIEIPVEEKHRGNFFVHFTFVKNSRSFSTTKYVYVPWTNKQLKLEFETFRDKLAPGQEEQWKIKISGPEGERLAAEMVATLYDASLDVFRANSFYFSIYPSYYSQFNWYVAKGFEQTYSSLYQKDWNDWVSGVSRTYESLNYFGYYFGYYGVYYKGGIRYSKDVDMCYECGVVDMEEAPPPPPPTMTEKTETMKKLNGDETSGKKNGETVEQQPETGDYSGVQVRTNLNETAFFYPHLETDAEGKIIINFTIPEALTRWKFLSFAHTKDLKYGMLSGETVTQKDLMVFPNPPRFFRENDEIIFTAKVSNLSEGDLQGTAILQLFDALTMKPVDADFGNTKPEITFNVKKEQSEGFKWKLKIPEGVNAVTYRVIAKTDKFSDGEESTLPVLVNRMLVTESLPLPIRGKTTKEFKFTKLLENKSTTLKHFKYTLEFTSNPAWYAIQALPYMMEYPYECSEQTFNRLYANSIATHIANSSPKIKKVFEQWKTVDKDALLSNLEKNQELKSLLLEETPWVMQAQNETEQKKRVGLLFDLNMMAREKASALKKLFDMQLANGGFPWFPGDRDNRYITQYIVTGFARLGKLNIDYNTANMNVDDKLKKSVEYLDYWIVDDYKNLLKWKVDLEKDHLGYIQIQYLYARSFFPELKMSSETEKVFEYYKGQAKKYWLNKGSYMQGMICIALHRYDERNTANDIIKSLKERSQQNEELGMYWKDNAGGYYWYQAPIETQALLVEAFNEVAKDLESVDAMRVWLLKHKQTNSWKTTKATSDACYALLISGTDWLDTEPNIEIQVGKYTIDPMTDKNIKVESGTGYFKTSWDKGEITNDMGNIKVEKKNVGVSWGAVYWQYFEQLDKITPHETPLKLNKKVFVEKTSDTGPILLPVEKGTKLKPGDKLIVRIELRVDREMEFVHMKDMRAAGFEPLNVISRYKYQGGLGYYESTRDASTNFFISWLPKGTYVFEYPLRVFHEGDFSNGITTIQCMYAPEFTSHSEGIRITVGE